MESLVSHVSAIASFHRLLKSTNFQPFVENCHLDSTMSVQSAMMGGVILSEPSVPNCLKDRQLVFSVSKNAQNPVEKTVPNIVEMTAQRTFF